MGPEGDPTMGPEGDPKVGPEGDPKDGAARDGAGVDLKGADILLLLHIFGQVIKQGAGIFDLLPP